MLLCRRDEISAGRVFPVGCLDLVLVVELDLVLARHHILTVAGAEVEDVVPDVNPKDPFTEMRLL
jgi:hypothetical protein